MTNIIAFILILAASSPNLISNALVSYDHIDSYQVTLRSSGDESSEEILYSFKKPGHIRMEFIRPHRGAVLVYNPVSGKVRVRPFGFLKFMVFTLDPDSWLLRSSGGHTVDRSDIGSLLKSVRRLQSHGSYDVREESIVGNREAMLVSIKGENGFAVNGINAYHLWLDMQSFLPLKVSAFNSRGGRIEEVVMDDLRINVEFPGDFFDL
jgi:outer membrane lipoprotein-sorting protein